MQKKLKHRERLQKSTTMQTVHQDTERETHIGYYLFTYKTKEELDTAVKEFAYVWYNHVRPHSYNQGRTPYAARIA